MIVNNFSAYCCRLASWEVTSNFLCAVTTVGQFIFGPCRCSPERAAISFYWAAWFRTVCPV